MAKDFDTDAAARDKLLAEAFRHNEPQPEPTDADLTSAPTRGELDLEERDSFRRVNTTMRAQDTTDVYEVEYRKLRLEQIVLVGGAFGPHANQDDALEAQLTVLHLIAIGGVLGANGGLTGNAAEGVALCQVKVTGGGRRLWCGRGVIIAECAGKEIVVIVLGKFGHTTFHFGMLRPKAGIADS